MVQNLGQQTVAFTARVRLQPEKHSHFLLVFLVPSVYVVKDVSSLLCEVLHVHVEI